MRALRIALVTAGLMAAGAVCGGVAGAVVGAAWVLLWAENPEIVPVLGCVGGVLGAVLGPVAAWGMMRHVPLWLALGATTLGTTAGGVAGLLFGPGTMILAALTGFAMAVIYLRLEKPLDTRLLRDGHAGTRLPAGGG